MISPKHAGLIMIAVAMILIGLSAAAEPVQDMKPGNICLPVHELRAKEMAAAVVGENVGYQKGGQAAVDELLNHFRAMCAAYQSTDTTTIAPSVELRNGIRIQCAK